MARSLLLVSFLVALGVACQPRQGRAPGEGPNPAPSRAPARALSGDAGADAEEGEAHERSRHPHFSPQPGDVKL